MNFTEYNSLTVVESLPNMISVDELTDKSDRTLIYGYDLERNTFHLYLLNNLFYLYIYSFKKETIVSMSAEGIIDVARCNPSKRAYPEACDYEFSKLVIKYGGHISFTTFNTAREYKQFYGDLIS